MAETTRSRGIAATALLAALGCVAVDPRPDYEDAARHIRDATGQAEVHRPGDDRDVARLREEILADGLTAHEAAQVALLQEPDLQASFLEIGVARADLVQSGLLENPSLAALIRFPTVGGAANVEAELAGSLLDLWRIPARKRLAAAELRRVVLRVSHAAALLAARAKAAYFRAVAAERTLEVEEENLETTRQLLELTLVRQGAGASTEIEVNLVRADHLEQEILTATARLAVAESRRELAREMGLAGLPEGLRLREPLPEPSERPLSAGRVLDLAEARRLDLRAAAELVERAREEVDLQRRGIFRRIEPGIALETDGTSRVAVGPSVDLELPIFDQNQAQVARAELRLHQAEKLLEALTLSLSQEVHGACQRYEVEAGTARAYEERLLPLWRANLELGREAFRLGRTGFLSVLESQRAYLAGRRQYVGRLEAFALTLPELERACAQPLSEILALGRGEAAETADGNRPEAQDRGGAEWHKESHP